MSGILLKNNKSQETDEMKCKTNASSNCFSDDLCNLRKEKNELKKIINSFKERLAGRNELKKVVNNIVWLFFDKIVRMGGGLLIGVLVARYLAPERYGALNYAIAFSSLFGAIATLGIDRIAVREIIKRPLEHSEIMGTLFIMRLLIGFLILLTSVISAYFINDKNFLKAVLVGVCSSVYIIQSVLVIDFYYQAEVKSKYTVITQNIAFLISGVIKVILIYLKASLIWFASVIVVEAFLASILLVISYQIRIESIKKWKFKPYLVGSFLKDSWPYIISNLTAIIYMRIDQIMIGNMLSEAQLGLYSVAVKISEVWFFIPMSIVASLFPAIIKSKSLGREIFLLRMQKLCDLLTYFGIVVAIVIGFISEFVIVKLFGAEYSAASGVLKLHVWTGAVICFGAIGSAWITTENLQKITFVKSILGALSNVVLNLIWIPVYGIKGAALATVIAQLVTTLVFYDNKTWQVTKVQLKSLIVHQVVQRFMLGFKKV